MNSLSWVDALIACGVAFSMLLGLFRGLVREVIAVVGWVVALILALRFSVSVSILMPGAIAWSALRVGLAALVIVVGVLALTALVGWLMRRLVVAVHLSLMDRFLGAGFGFVRAGLVLLLGVFFSYNTVLADQAWWKDSEVLPRVQSLAQWVVPLLSESMPWAQRSELHTPLVLQAHWVAVPTSSFG